MRASIAAAELRLDSANEDAALRISLNGTWGNDELTASAISSTLYRMRAMQLAVRSAEWLLRCVFHTTRIHARRRAASFDGE